MIPTIQLDILLTTCLGLLFGLWRREGGEPFWRERAYRIGLQYVYGLGVGIAGAAYLINSAWMWMYWVDPARIPTWQMVVIFGLGYPGCFTFGYLLSRELARVGMEVTGFLGMVLLLILAIFLSLGRLWSVSTYADFQRGVSTPLLRLSPLHVSGLAILLLIGLPAAVYGLFWAHRKVVEEI